MGRWLLVALAVLTASMLAPRLGADSFGAERAIDAELGAANRPPVAPPPAAGAAPAPLRAFTDAQGRSCRVYIREVTIEGARQTALATICREPNGRWVFSR